MSHGKTTLVLAFHNHQPDGNFDHVFAQAYADCYGRLLEALDAAPHVRCALHHTGALFEWIERHQPGYLARMRALVERGQVEVLGGGFYEPMLAVLPERDALGQIAMMGDFCQARFGVRPEGMWLAERVWEPGLPLLLARAGVRYTLIDDNHFRSAGMEGPLRGYYATEKAGAAMAIFPIDQKLRYAIPFATPEKTIRALHELREESGGGDCVVTYGDDGEKFGVWPGTREWVWDKGWLVELFRLLGEEQGRIEMALPAEVLRARPPSGRVYLPTASYEEMGEWALPAAAQRHYLEVRHRLEERQELDQARPYLRGGIWQGFLAKYGEANFMHKKMIAVSDRVAAACAAEPGRDDERALMQAELYRAQCNCSYWHGLFGGLYLNSLRDTVYRHLLVAEAFADAQLGRPAPAWAPNRSPTAAGEVRVEERDVDADLETETVIESCELDVTVRPHDGGAVQELAYRPKSFMLTNVLGRHEEAYHQKLRDFIARAASGESDAPQSIHDLVQVKEPGLDQHLVYDRYPRYCFVDHFLAPEETLDAFAAGSHHELGDFVMARYTRVVPGPGAREQVHLERLGVVAGRLVRMDKRIEVRPASEAGGPALVVLYQLRLVEGEWLDVRFAPELSLTLLDGSSPERSYRVAGRELAPEERRLASRGALAEVAALELVNEVNRFRVELDFGERRPEVWRFPLETVSMSEAGFERTYQGSTIVPLYPLRLTSEPASVTVAVRLADL